MLNSHTSAEQFQRWNLRTHTHHTHTHTHTTHAHTHMIPFLESLASLNVNFRRNITSSFSSLVIRYLMANECNYGEYNTQWQTMENITHSDKLKIVKNKICHFTFHRTYKVIKKSLCTRRLQYTQLMIWRGPSRIHSECGPCYTEHGLREHSSACQ